MYENVKVKPILATEIKDIKIAREIVEYIKNNPVPPERTERLQKEAEEYMARMMKK
jgi:hypothetical protein